jgi:hypothetical protein
MLISVFRHYVFPWALSCSTKSIYKAFGITTMFGSFPLLGAVTASQRRYFEVCDAVRPEAYLAPQC